MQITQKTEDEVVIALHDNGLDVALTIDALLEGPQVFNLNKFVIFYLKIVAIFFLRNRGLLQVRKRKIELAVLTKKKKKN